MAMKKKKRETTNIFYTDKESGTRFELKNIPVQYRRGFKKFICLDDLLEATFAFKVEHGIIHLEMMPVDEAKPLIDEYMKEHRSAWTGEIAEDLGIDYKVTIDALKELEAEGKITSRGNDHETIPE